MEQHMAEANTDSTQGCALVLPEEFTIAQSAEYYQLLVNHVEEGRDIQLDTDSVTRIDAAGVQLLYVIQRALMDAGHTLKWNSVGETFRESVALLGMCELLAMPAEA